MQKVISIIHFEGRRLYIETSTVSYALLLHFALRCVAFALKLHIQRICSEMSDRKAEVQTKYFALPVPEVRYLTRQTLATACLTNYIQYN